MNYLISIFFKMGWTVSFSYPNMLCSPSRARGYHQPGVRFTKNSEFPRPPCNRTENPMTVGKSETADTREYAAGGPNCLVDIAHGVYGTTSLHAFCIDVPLLNGSLFVVLLEFRVRNDPISVVIGRLLCTHRSGATSQYNHRDGNDNYTRPVTITA